MIRTHLPSPTSAHPRGEIVPGRQQGCHSKRAPAASRFTDRHFGTLLNLLKVHSLSPIFVAIKPWLRTGRYAKCVLPYAFGRWSREAEAGSLAADDMPDTDHIEPELTDHDRNKGRLLLSRLDTSGKGHSEWVSRTKTGVARGGIPQ